MKLMKYTTVCSIALLLFAACKEDEGPSIDDHFLLVLWSRNNGYESVLPESGMGI